MKSLVVGTAGHIDHGKSALVRALTGMDPDRLAEEKRRGITIDLGFAHRELRLPSGEPLRLSLVDVPGHERFIRNMLAGAGGLDLAILVIAADEGVMPQTREHFEICRLLGLRGGVVVLTKSDLATPALLAAARGQAQDLVRGSFLADAPILPVSSRTGAGLRELEAALISAASQSTARDQEGPARLPVDRVFTLRGFGTVVTGTLISGRIATGSELELWTPGENGQPAAARRVRVRGVQVHGQAAPEAAAGIRAALNLAAVEAGSLSRGAFLAEPGIFRPTFRWDVRIHWIPGFSPVPLHTTLRLHLHSAESLARLAWSESPHWAQLVLRRPLPAIAGDHFILRRLSPAATLGGGIVVEAGASRRARGENRGQRLERLMAASPAEKLWIWTEAAGPAGLSISHAAASLGRRRAEVRAWSQILERRNQAVTVGEALWTQPAWAAGEQALLAALEASHQAQPLSPGFRSEALSTQLPVPSRLIRVMLDRLAAHGQVERVGELWRQPGRGAELSDRDAQARQRIEQAFLAAGFRTPTASEVLAQAGVDLRRAEQLLRLLCRDGILLRLTPELLLHRDAMAHLRQLLAAHRAKTGTARLSVTDFKSLAGVTRKHAIPLLEYLDRIHATRRIGEEREILAP